jgi:hypothetical protein
VDFGKGNCSIGFSEKLGAAPICEDGQVCQMEYFQTKNRNLGKFCSVLQWKMLVYFMTI